MVGNEKSLQAHSDTFEALLFIFRSFTNPWETEHIIKVAGLQKHCKHKSNIIPFNLSSGWYIGQGGLLQVKDWTDTRSVNDETLAYVVVHDQRGMAN